jgi:intracellular sulfur oxidation DsrE/DsrF family protein
MTARRRLTGAILFAVVLFGSAACPAPALASDASANAPAGNAPQGNPFATHRLVLQLSDASMEKQKLIISGANSVLKDYPDTVSIVVVAFGPGVAILYADSPEREAVDSLAEQGVEFDVCMNTINTIRRRTGHAPKLNPHARKVPYGIPRLMQLVSKGYILVRP